MIHSSPGEGIIQNEPGAFVVPENKEVLKTKQNAHIDMRVFKGPPSQQKELLVAKARTI